MLSRKIKSKILAKNSQYGLFIIIIIEKLVIQKPYRREECVYLSLFAIAPEYQPQGLGEKLLEDCMNEIPIKLQNLHSDGNLTHVYGPQKLILSPTKDALRLYQKARFEVLTTAICEMNSFIMSLK